MLKKHIESLVRVQTSLNRNIEKGIILDRNERVDVFDNTTFKKIIKSISKYSLSATPDMTSLYKQIAKYHELKRNNIYITQGITECISHIIFSILNKSDEAILLYPTYLLLLTYQSDLLNLYFILLITYINIFVIFLFLILFLP